MVNKAILTSVALFAAVALAPSTGLSYETWRWQHLIDEVTARDQFRDCNAQHSHFKIELTCETSDETIVVTYDVLENYGEDDQPTSERYWRNRRNVCEALILEKLGEMKGRCVSTNGHGWHMMSGALAVTNLGVDAQVQVREIAHFFGDHILRGIISIKSPHPEKDRFDFIVTHDLARITPFF